MSVGSQHDNIVNVFDWKSNLKIASNKVSAKVVAVSFSEDGNYFVTVGNRHVKYWYLEGGRKYKEPIPLMGRSAILGELRNNDFCAVACGKGDMIDSTYGESFINNNKYNFINFWIFSQQSHAMDISSSLTQDDCLTNGSCVERQQQTVWLHLPNLFSSAVAMPS